MDLSSQSWQQLVAQYVKNDVNALIAIVGQTSSGKTSFSLKVAQYLISSGHKAAIVNADSRQCYKYLNIGTGKIKPNQMQGIKHYMFDVLDPKEPITMYWYKKRAEDTIKQLHQENIIPILVGGSMLYVSSITDERSERSQKTKVELQLTNPTEALHLGMEKNKELANAIIERRVQAMLEEGWLQEVQQLIRKDYNASDPGFISLGYREIIEVAKGNLSLEEAKQRIIQKTKKYAKRQRTWWKSDSRIHWITAEE